MRKLPLLLALLLLATALPAQGASLLKPAPAPALLEAEEEEVEAEEGEAEEDEEEEACEPGEDELCEVEEEEPRGKGKHKGQNGDCLLKSARAAVTVNPGKRRLRLSVHYRTWKPASVSVEAVLHGVQGAVYLGTDHARFRRSGVYRDTFELAEKQTKKALAARKVSVDLQVVNTSCSLHLTEAVRRPKH